MKMGIVQIGRAVFGIAFAGALSFGASQAFASNEVAARTCPATGYDYAYASCGFGCPGNQGYCSETGICRCGQIP